MQWTLSPPADDIRPAAPVAAVAPVVQPIQPAKPDPAPQPEPQPEPLLSEDQLARLERYSAAGQRLLAERLAATRALLAQADDERYTLELYVTENSDPSRMERFLLRARELVPLEELHVIPVVDGGQYRLWVLFGDFANRADAAAATRRLPPRYQEAFRATPRSFGELRHQL
jgi:MSHA biogenesis protein MshM